MKNGNKTNILIVDDEQTLCETLSLILEEEGYRVSIAFDGLEAIQKIESEKFDLIFCDLRMPRLDGLKVLEKVEEVCPEAYFIVMTAYGSMDTTIEALKRGAYDYVVKPLIFDDLLLKLRRLVAFKNLRIEDRDEARGITEQFALDHLLGQGREMKAIYSLIQKVAPTLETILITGEMGAGKGKLAKAIHYLSDQKEKPFWALRCDSFGEKQIEASLFGEGGIFRENKTGTLYLSEISALPLSLQIKLAGIPATGPQTAGPRLIVSSTKDLAKEVENGNFSEELLYRTHLIEIKIPPLRARRGDIPFLIKYFVQTFSERLGKKARFVEDRAVDALMNYRWQGNIRELRNVLERAVLLCDIETPVLKFDDLQVCFDLSMRNSETSRTHAAVPPLG